MRCRHQDGSILAAPIWRLDYLAEIVAAFSWIEPEDTRGSVLKMHLYYPRLILPQISLQVGEVWEYFTSIYTDQQKAAHLGKMYDQCYGVIKAAYTTGSPGWHSPQVTRSWDPLLMNNLKLLYLVRDFENGQPSSYRRAILPVDDDEVRPSIEAISNGFVPPEDSSSSSGDRPLEMARIRPTQPVSHDTPN